MLPHSAAAEVKVIPLCPSDSELVEAFCWHGIFTTPEAPRPPMSILDEPDVRQYFEGWGLETDMGWKAVCGAEPVGAVWMRLLNRDCRGYGWVDDETPELSIAVLPEWRGLGIGTRLMEAFLERPLPRVSLSVTKINPAVRLYKRMGFSVVADDGETLTMLRVAPRP